MPAQQVLESQQGEALPLTETPQRADQDISVEKKTEEESKCLLDQLDDKLEGNTEKLKPWATQNCTLPFVLFELYFADECLFVTKSFASQISAILFSIASELSDHYQRQWKEIAEKLCLFRTLPPC